MDFLVNDLSVHGQFKSTTDFFDSVEALMLIRNRIRRAGRELYCHRNLTSAQVTPTLTMLQAIQGMPVQKRRAWMQWLGRVGPYWMEDRQHADDEWLETANGTIVTDSAVGEAAFCRLHNLQRETVSLAPSDWLTDPITVTWRKSDDQSETVDVPNHWQLKTVDDCLEKLPKPFNSWDSLEAHVRHACGAIIISADAFARLEGLPYVKSVAEWIHILLEVLEKLNAGFDDNGNRTAEFVALYETYFKGKTPYFTDESDSNKRDFEAKLTFPHPTTPGTSLFCPWHGKVNSPKSFPPIRIHFTWPATPDSTLAVVYVGPKLTMR